MPSKLRVVSVDDVFVKGQVGKPPGKRNGQSRQRYKIDQLEPTMQSDFRKYGSVAINSKRWTAVLAPFENLLPSDAQDILEESFPNSGIVMREKEPYFETVSCISTLDNVT